MTDASTDLWKTLRIWSCKAATRGIELDETELLLFTTAELPPGTVGHLLQHQESGVRDEDRALASLERVISESSSEANRKAYEDFLGLDGRQRARLISRIRVLGGAPDIEGVRSQLLRQVVLAVGHAAAEPFLQRLEGWFLQRAVEQLRSPGSDPISGVEFDAVFTDRRNQFGPNNLPIDQDILEMPTSVEEFADHVFVRQLGLLGVGNTRILYAVRDYLRAFTQRSRWSDDNLLLPGEIGAYERRLVEEWEARFAIMNDELGAEAAEAEKRIQALGIYRWVETEARFSIRPDCHEAFVTKGSYQMLADERTVGWHPDFLARLMALLEPVAAH